MNDMLKSLAKESKTLNDRMAKMERRESVRLGSQVTAGNWTPTLVNTTNVASSTANEGQYIRVGNIVQCVVAVSITPTAAGAVVLRLTLPVAPANFADIYGASGVGAIFSEVVAGSIEAKSAGTRVELKFNAPNNTARVWRLVFSYQLS